MCTCASNAATGIHSHKALGELAESARWTAVRKQAIKSRPEFFEPFLEKVREERFQEAVTLMEDLYSKRYPNVETLYAD